MSTPEGRVKDWFARQVKKHWPEAVRIRWPAGQYGSKGVSDDILCVKGIFVAVEAKTDTGKVTPLQKDFLDRVTKAGGVALVLKGKDEGIFAAIEEGIHDVRNKY